MTLQTISQLILLGGLILSALGGFGSYYYGKIEDAKSKYESEQEQLKLNARIAELQASAAKTQANTELIYQAINVKRETWTEVEMKNVPSGVTESLS